MSYKADIENISACLRVFKQEAAIGQDPYEFSATVVYHEDGKIAELKGVRTQGDVSFSSMRKAVCKAFYIKGVDYVFWERRSEDKVKKIFLNTKTLKIERNLKN